MVWWLMYVSQLGLEWSNDLHLKRDLLTKFFSIWSFEAKDDIVHSVSTGDVVENSEWNLNLLLLFCSNVLVNCLVIEFDWDYVLCLLLS